MTLYKSLLHDIEKSPDGPQVGAFFDFDGTVIAGFSATVFLREQLLRGDMSPGQAAELLTALAQFSLGKVSFSGLMLSAAKFMRGTSEQTYIDFGELIYQQQIARKIYPESRALVEAHLAKGHTVAVISSATLYQVLPAARDLNIKHVLCSHYEIEDGKFTGDVVRPLCFGEGKVLAAETLVKSDAVDLDQSFFYTDSDDDLQLLEKVGHPQVLNPNSRLARIAEERGWPVRIFKSRGRPRLSDYVRSAAATMSIVPSYMAGIPIRALTGSNDEAQNFSRSLFADVSSALIGLDLQVEGEKYLWQERPAVFVFNHQSKADVIIMARLLRRDFVAVGKKEIGQIPLLGKIMELGGTVLIDRQNAASAVQAMRPLVDALRHQGKSVIIAPEGTRSISPRLAPFKKGAFHLAIQAGVPIVPIVIRNAVDVAPKGEFVFRAATVEVEVLPPVDTSGWRTETIAAHVKEVRGMFLKSLGQEVPNQNEPEGSKISTGGNNAASSRGSSKSRVSAKRTAKAAPQPNSKVKAGPKAGPAVGDVH